MFDPIILCDLYLLIMYELLCVVWFVLVRAIRHPKATFYLALLFVADCYLGVVHYVKWLAWMIWWMVGPAFVEANDFPSTPMPPVGPDTDDAMSMVEMVGYGAIGLFSVALSVLVLSLLWRLTRWLIPRLQRRRDETLGLLSGMTPERMMPGSNYIRMARPSYQAVLMASVGEGPFYVSGQCFRVDDFLLTAWHVVSGADSLKVVTEMGELVMHKSRFEQLEGDVAFARMTQPEFSRLGMSTARLSKVALDNDTGAYVHVTGPGDTSLGLVQPHNVFGFVTYSGSTKPGFSGAPYAINNMVLGMHLGGNTTNMGYEAGYLQMLMQRLQENTEDFMLLQASKPGAKFQHKRSPYNPDEHMVRMNGRYYLVDDDTLDKMYARAGRLRGECVVPPLSPSLVKECLHCLEGSLGSSAMEERILEARRDQWNSDMERVRVLEMEVTRLRLQLEAANARATNGTNLPLAPADIMYQDSGNALGGPAMVPVNAPVNGACNQLGIARVEKSSQPKLIREPQYQTLTTVMPCQPSIPARQNEVLASTSKEARSPGKKQNKTSRQKRRLKERLRAALEATQPGVVVQSGVKSTSGSIVNLK